MERRSTKYQKFIFNETPGLNLAVPENALPMFFFNLLLTDDLLNTLLQKTNEYADRIINKRKVKPPARKPLASFHYLLTIPQSGIKTNPTKKCNHCIKNQVRRESRYVCGYCPDQPALCNDPYFRL